MAQVQLPKNVSRIAADTTFCFACHPGVKCFTDCCRQLELALTPYDVLRLKHECKLPSSTFLENYVIQEQEADDSFPRFYLTMVDDGKASCVFVSEAGCTVYSGRPGACRAYPMGRAAIRKEDAMEEFFVLLREEHCHGFEENEKQTTASYSKGQGLERYSNFNDSVAILLQHEKIRKGLKLTEKQTEFFVLALYDLDTFRTQLNAGHLPQQDLYSTKKDACKDDENLLLFGIDWLQRILFQQ